MLHLFLNLQVQVGTFQKRLRAHSGLSLGILSCMKAAACVSKLLISKERRTLGFKMLLAT